VQVLIVETMTAVTSGPSGAREVRGGEVISFQQMSTCTSTILAAVDRGLSLMIEKPLATELAASSGFGSDNKSESGCSGRLHAALPPALAGGEEKVRTGQLAT